MARSTVYIYIIYYIMRGQIIHLHAPRTYICTWYTQRPFLRLCSINSSNGTCAYIKYIMCMRLATVYYIHYIHIYIHATRRRIYLSNNPPWFCVFCVWLGFHLIVVVVVVVVSGGGGGGCSRWETTTSYPLRTAPMVIYYNIVFERMREIHNIHQRTILSEYPECPVFNFHFSHSPRVLLRYTVISGIIIQLLI